MASTGIKYFWDLTSLPYSDILVYWDFNGYAPPIVTAPYWAPSSAIGVINDSDNFDIYPGSGNFNGNQYVSVLNDINDEDWTAFLIYQKHRVSKEILFSSLQGTGTNCSGFYIGVNESNKLFMEYWNSVEGPQVITLPTNIGDKNLISVTKSDGSVYLRYFDANFKRWEGQQFIPYGNNFIDCNKWYLGGSPVKPSNIPINNFSGQIDEFFVCKNNLLEEYQAQLASGFYAVKNPLNQTITTTCTPITYVSGYFAITGYGITGYQPIVTNSITDDCGNVLNFYGYSGVTGALSGYFTAIYTGLSGCTSVTGYSDAGYNINTGFVNTLGMDGVTIFYETDTDDVLNVWATTGELEDRYKNRDAPYDNVNGVFFVDSNINPKTLDAYFNGQWQLPSGYTPYQDGYSIKYLLSGDYFLSGRNVNSSGFYYLDQDNTILYDVFSGARDARTVSSIASGQTVPDFNFYNKWVFFNGQLLTSGLNYSAPNTILIDIPDGYNVLSTVDMDTNLIGQTGINIGTFDFNVAFLRHTSQVWLNGVRLSKGYDYIESARYDLLSGNYQLPDDATDQIYNSNDDFWNL